MPAEKFLNRRKQQISNTPGTGAVVLGSALAGFLSLGSAQNGQSFRVLFTEGSAWEVATGCTYTHSTTTLTRGTLEESSTGSRLSLTSAGVATVIVSANWFESMDAIQPIGPMTLTALQAQSTTGLVEDVSTAYVSNPEWAKGTWIWRGTGKGGWRQQSMSGVFAQLARWWAMPIAMRGRVVMQGGTPFVAAGAVDLASAVVPATYDSAGLTAAYATAAARSTNKVILIDQNVTLGSDVVSENNVWLVSTNGSTISGAFGIIINTGTRFVGLNFSGSWLQFGTLNGKTGVQILGCRFANTAGAGIAIADYQTSNGEHHNNNMVALNEFVTFGYGLYLQRWNSNSIVYNKLSNSTGSGRGIFMVSGSRNKIMYNEVDGTINGIAVLVDARYTMEASHNVIVGNIVRGASEEGISLDGYGNELDRMASRDTVTIASTANTPASNPSFVVNRTNTTGIEPGRHTINFVTGPLIGNSYPITFVASVVSGTSIRIQIANNSINAAELASAAGSLAVIQLMVYDNIIRDNVVLDVPTPIMLWGVGHRTSVTGNYVRSNSPGWYGIAVFALGLPPSSTAQNTLGAICTPSRVMVTNNFAQSGKIAFAGMSFINQTNTVNLGDQIPHFAGLNSPAAAIETWQTGSNVPFGDNVATVTNYAGDYNGEVQTFEGSRLLELIA